MEKYLWIKETRSKTWLAVAMLLAYQILFFSISFFFNFILFLNLKHCISFAKHQNESATGIHTFPILIPPPSSLPTPSLWVVPVHQPQASSIVHRTWTGNSFHTWYYTCFNAILPKLPTLSLSHKVHKTVLYISVSFAVSYTGLFWFLQTVSSDFLSYPLSSQTPFSFVIFFFFQLDQLRVTFNTMLLLIFL